MSDSLSKNRLLLAAALAGMFIGGCHFHDGPAADPAPMMVNPDPIATEKNRMSLPNYVIEPPDILEIDAIKVVPKPPYKIEALDSLGVNVTGTLRDQPITGTYAVEPGGTLNLGPAYGRVKVSNLTLEEAAEAVYRQLNRILKQPEVSVTLAASAGMQAIQGQHRVGPDGTVNLGTYGTVFITGLTVDEAKTTIEKHLSKYLDTPEVSVDVFSYASKVYYIVGQGAGLGDSLTRVQITGNETVLDAVSQINGLSRVANKKKIFIARPAPDHFGCDQILRVNWDDITQGGNTATNYQILPGDRLYISQDELVAFDSFVNKVTAPFERLFGATSLGVQSIEQIKRPGLNQGGNN